MMFFSVCMLMQSSLIDPLIQTATRDIVVDSVSGLTIDVTPVFNCNL